MSKPSPPAFQFSDDRHSDLRRLGLIEAQIVEVESVLPGCAVLIEEYPTLTEMRDHLDELVGALDVVESVFNARTKPTREALNRWQMAAHALGHPLGSDPQFGAKLDVYALLTAAREARNSLGDSQRRRHTAQAEPIRRVAEALALGWVKGHKKGAPPYEMAAATFREVVQFAYELMGFRELYVPERAIRVYRRWCTNDAVRRSKEREAIGTIAGAEQFNAARYSRLAKGGSRYARPPKN